MNSRMRVLLAGICLTTMLTDRTWCDDQEDAAQLRDEATATLKKNSVSTVPPADYAMAIYRLEKAQAILEAAHDTDCPLAQEVNSSLFWARRCSNVHIISEVEKIHAANPALKLASTDPKPKKAAQATAEGDSLPEIDAQAEAKAAFESAQKFATEHAGDDWMIAMRWFQMVNEFPGTDYSLKAVQLARDAQMRFAARQGAAPKETLADGAETKPLLEGDKLCEQGNFEKAIAAYKESIKLKDTIAAHRKLGHAFYQRAQQRKDEVNKELDAFLPQYKEAWTSSWYFEGSSGGSRSNPKKFNPLTPQWQAAKQRRGEIQNDAEHVWSIYVYGQWEFEKVLKVAPNNKDFDAAAYEGITLSARIEDKNKAQTYLKKFLKDYEPANDIERFIYEYCKTELERISH